MEHFYALEWTIDNFNFWNKEVHGSCITSADCVSPRLTLYPRGKNGQEKCMAVGIEHSVTVLPGELFFFGSDESLIHSVQVINPSKRKIITTQGPQLENVLDLMKNNEENRLILRYRYRTSNYQKLKMCTSLNVVDATLEINADDSVCNEKISAFPYQRDGIIQSVQLWYVNEGEKTELQLKVIGREIRVFLVKTCVSFLNRGGVFEKCEEKEHLFRDKGPWVVFLISRNEFSEKCDKLLLSLKITTGRIEYSDNTCIFNKIVCKIQEKSGCFSEKKPSETITSDPTAEDSITALTNDLMCLYQDQHFSDVQLYCGGVSFPVHKNILSARSQVFNRLLSSDMREAASGSVDIEDLDAPTLARFLTFLYTGAVGEDLHWESALKLYYAADKNEVTTLKRECVKFLCANVAIANVCEILSLADKHRDDQLTEVSRRFILENYNEVLSSKEWKCLMKREPLLVAETVTDFAEKNYVKKHDFR